MQARAFVAVRNVRQAVRGFDVELLVDFHGFRIAKGLLRIAWRLEFPVWLACMAESSIPDARCIGIVLAGGQSRRMGRDKALLPYADATLLRHQVDTLAQVCGRVVVSGDYAGYDCLRDIRPGMGPLSGMHAAAREFEKHALLFLPVDMPAMTARVLRKLLAHGGSCHFEKQPLPCLFPEAPALAAAIEHMWHCQGEGSAVHALHRMMASRALDFSEAVAFENINTPEHWQRFNPSIES